MFAQKFVAEFKRNYLSSGKTNKRNTQRVDLVSEQVKQVLQASGQKLILEVRG